MHKLSALILLLTAISAHAGPSHPRIKPEAADPSCVKLADMPGARDGITIDDKGRPYVECDISNLGYRVRKGLWLLKNFGQANDKIPFDDLLLNNPWEFFLKRVKLVNLEDANDSACKKELIGAFVREPNVLTVCNNSTSFDDSTIASMLLHEARHAGFDKPEARGSESSYPHVTCAHGDSVNADGACDISMSNMGAYDVGAHFEIAFSRNEKFSPALRASARAAAIEMMASRFNEYPDGTAKGVVLVKENRQIDFYNGQTITNILSTYSPKVRVVSGIQSQINFVSTADAMASKYSYDHREPERNLHFASNLTNAKDKSDLKDYSAINNSYNCSLFSSYVRCASYKNTAKTVVMKFSNRGKGLRFFMMPLHQLDEYNSPLRVGFVVTQETNGKLTALELPMNWEEIKEGNPEPLPASPQGTNLVSSVIDTCSAPAYNPQNLEDFWLFRDSGKVFTQVPAREDAKGNKIPAQMVEPAGINAPGNRTERMLGDFFWGADIDAL